MLLRTISLPKRVLSDMRYGETGWAYIFLLPTLLLFGIFTFYPTLAAFVTSFQAFSGFSTDRPFVGLANYEYVLTSEPLFWRSAFNTILFTLGTVPVAVLVPLAIAVLIDRLRPGYQTFFKSAFYLPGVVSAVVVGLMWSWIFYPFNSGLANWFAGLLDLGPFIWLGKTNLALFSLMATRWFSGNGAAIILYAAAMAAIPDSLYEAADLDVASGWSKFRNITWPLIIPTTLFVTVTATIESFQVFDLIYTMTKGGPQLSTYTVVYHIYTTAFQNFQFGVASAMAVLLGLVVVLISAIQFRFFSSTVEF
jgi:multiple sugar transport system permease protein